MKIKEREKEDLENDEPPLRKIINNNSNLSNSKGL